MSLRSVSVGAQAVSKRSLNDLLKGRTQGIGGADFGLAWLWAELVMRKRRFWRFDASRGPVGTSTARRLDPLSNMSAVTRASERIEAKAQLLFLRCSS
ncbi:hypothetical protein AWC27_01930 [Mycobacterium szulgai]|uniref:Uncharacterized protein n=1 Tax=Mycobacterium szulgai TaxID=1787 RepID=A0A1X2EFM6_MYCSZ|nr:hypothetical protein AWC27_01930 [Mycobacterium szulgai]